MEKGDYSFTKPSLEHTLSRYREFVSSADVILVRTSRLDFPSDFIKSIKSLTITTQAPKVPILVKVSRVLKEKAPLSEGFR